MTYMQILPNDQLNYLLLNHNVNHFIAYRFYSDLVHKYNQFNDHTKISLEHYRSAPSYFVVEVSPFNAHEIKQKNKLGFLPLVYRNLGKIINNKQLETKGKYWELPEINMVHKELEVTTFYYTEKFNNSSFDALFRTAYWPSNDILFIEIR